MNSGVIFMFQAGDYLVYGLEGVCRVTAVGPVRLSGVPRDKLYYTLAPCGRQDAIYIPVDSPVFMRPPLARGEIEALLEALPGLEPCTDLPADSKQLAPFYQEIIQSHDLRRVLQLYKTLFRKQQLLSGSRPEGVRGGEHHALSLRGVHVGDLGDGGGLTGTVDADDADLVTLSEKEGNIVQHPPFHVGLGNILCSE